MPAVDRTPTIAGSKRSVAKDQRPATPSQILLQLEHKVVEGRCESGIPIGGEAGRVVARCALQTTKRSQYDALLLMLKVSVHTMAPGASM